MSSSQLQLLAAGAPELVRSSQKDRFYTGYITSLLSDVSRQALPLRHWLRWQREMQLGSELLYYFLTTVYGNQTLGEEYCNTVQVGPKAAPPQVYNVPSVRRRAFSIFLQTFGLYAIEKGLEVLYRRIRQRRLTRFELTEQQYESLEKIVGFVEELFSTLSQLHLALFYMQGLFYHIGKRVAGIQYLMVRYRLPGGSSEPGPQLGTYKLLGWILLCQLAFKLLNGVWEMLKRSKLQRLSRDAASEQSYEETPGAQKLFIVPPQSDQSDGVRRGGGCELKCPLCLEMCSSQTATTCGHIFCWRCIAEWCSERTECPVCRTAVQPQQLVALQHFVP